MTRSGDKAGGGHQAAGNRAFGAGLTMAVSVGLFAFGGLWIDEQLGTKPWFLLLLVFLGMAGGMLHLVLVVAPEMWPFGKPAKNDDTRRPSSEPSEPTTPTPGSEPENGPPTPG